MNRIYLFLLLIFVVFSCSNYYDKGKEYQIVESETTTEFQKLKFEESIICKECHETIYDEFMTSMHSKSSIYQDAIFKAVWEKHPNFLEEKQFNCAQCHTPAADNLVDFMSSELKQFPNKNNASQNEGVSCAVCHRIESIEQHRTANRNIYIEDTHTYYGISTGMSHSHQSNNENDLYFNGQVCKGCHSHRENSEGYLIDITESESENKWQTCVTCHMPLTPGTGTFKKMDRKHMNHSFPGAHVSPGMLSEHIVFSAKNIESQLEISVKNKAPHDLFIQAFRIAYLKVSIIENDKIIKEFEPIVLEKILENKDGECLSIVAKKETKNTFIKGSENKIFLFDFNVQNGDIAEVELGFQLVKNKFFEELKLQKYKELSEYRVLKTKQIIIE